MHTDCELFVQENKALVKTWLCAENTTTPLHLAAGQYPCNGKSVLRLLLTFARNYLSQILNIRDHNRRTPLKIARNMRTHKPSFTRRHDPIHQRETLYRWEVLQEWADSNVELLKEARRYSKVGTK